LIFRGAIFRIAEESLGTAAGLVLSALLFRTSHLGNKGVTVIGALALLTGGIILGLAYCHSRSFWLPIGAHLGWNFTMGAPSNNSRLSMDPLSGDLAGKISGYAQPLEFPKQLNRVWFLSRGPISNT
jgi:CAAX protease family protein